MSLYTWAKGVFGGPPPAVARLRASSSNPDNPDEANQWRKLGRASTRNLADHDHREMVKQCDRSAKVDSMSRAHVRLVRSITVGAQEVGPEIRCRDEKARDSLQKLADLIWNLPGNDFGTGLGDLMDGLTVSGSMIQSATTARGADGRGAMTTTFAAVDPGAVSDVLVDPGNVRQPIAVLRDAWGGGSSGLVAHPVIAPDDSVHKLFRGTDGKPLPLGTRIIIPKTGRYVSDLTVTMDAPCFYAGVNKSGPQQTLGISDLYASLDLMGLLDELVFNGTERTVNFGAYSIHVTFPRGTSDKDIADKMAVIKSDLESGRGRAIGTTDDVEVKAIAATLQAGESATMERTARTHALIGLGPWPIHIFSDGGATNLATAVEQGSPVANFLLDRQNVFRRFMVRLVTYAIRQFPEGQHLLDANADAHVHLPLPVIVAKDTTRESNVLAVETNTLVTAVAEGFIELEAAQREWRDSATRYGFHFTPQDSPDAAEFAAEKANALSLPPLRVADLGGPQKPTEGTPNKEAA